MNKLLLTILFISIAAFTSCQKKEVATANDSTLADAPTSSSNYTPNYKTPPSNRVTDAVAWTTDALNNRDSAGFWNSLTWENRDRAGYPELFRETQTLWDSTKGSHVDVTVLTTKVFSHTVHDSTHIALFAYAVLNMKISGAKHARLDSLTAILRVENGKWLLGSYSFDDPNKPFRRSPEHGLH